MRRFSLRYACCLTVAIAALGGCAIKPVASVANETLVRQPSIANPKNSSLQAGSIESTEKRQATPRLQRLSIFNTRQTGRLQDSQLDEVSGLAVSNRYPGLLYAINDSGNTPTLFAIDETGSLIEQWDIAVKNRDWEEMTQVHLAGTRYLVIGDTGDNLRVHNSATLHLFREPQLPAIVDSLSPEHSISFSYSDGARNVEAFSAIGNTLYMLSKEPIVAGNQIPHRVYQLDLPTDLTALNSSTRLTAQFIGTMPSRAGGLEARLAASLAGVNLSHPTSMEFDTTGNTAYILTYREVLRIDKDPGQTWANALSKNAKRIHAHTLSQAEALTISPGRAIWFTSEKKGAPIWAIPLTPPL